MPARVHYLENHCGHLMFVKPEEREFVTADLVPGQEHAIEDWGGIRAAFG